MRKAVFAALIAAAVAMPWPASAWGFGAHKYIMERTIELLPAEIKPFFQNGRTFLVEHVVDPDLWRTVGWEEESPRHFVDMDAYGPHPFTALPHAYEDAVKKYGREFVVKNGTLPWRVDEIYRKLVEAFSPKTGGGYGRDNVKLFSAVITHYVSDAHVPFHAASNHDGQLTGQWGIHARFESELFDRYRGTLKIDPGPLVSVKSPRELMFESLVASYPYVAPILAADKAAVQGRDVYDDAYFELMDAKVRPILEKRITDSIVDSASIIAAAWIEAGRPAMPLEVPKTPRKVRRQ
jgi:hypothetical protein